MYSITISLQKRLLYLLKDHKIVKEFPIGVGKMLTSTPTGHYTILNKQPYPGGPFGAYWLGLSRPHYGIHGTDAPWTIGHLVSHGCVRMHNKDVLELASKVTVGTPVLIRSI